MSQALIISNNSLLNDIYEVNLKAYVNCDCNFQDSYELAIQNLEVNKNFSVIVCISHINNEDIASKLYNYMNENSVDIPLVVIGEKSTVSNFSDIVTLASNLNVKNLLKALAKILEVTPKSMANLEVPDFYPIPIKLFKNFPQVPCDTFLRVSKSHVKGEYVLLWENDTRHEEKIGEYLDKGVTTLYVPAVDRLNVINQATGKLVDVLDSSKSTTEEKLDAVEQGFEVFANSLDFGEHATNEMMDLSKRCISTIQETAKDVPKLKSLLGSLISNKTRYVYMHSIMTTYVSNHIVNNISWGGEGHSEKITFVLFFHDVYLVPIYNKYPDFKYEEDLVFNDVLSDKEKDMVLNHARLASELVKTFPRCPMGADAIVLQHHGVTNGTGFTMDFKDDVSPLAKVIIVAESFVDEILKSKENGKELDLEKNLESLNKKFKRHTYKKIISTLENIQM